MIDVCVPYGPRPDLEAPFAKAHRAWSYEGIDIFTEGIWTPERLFNQAASRNAAARSGSAPWILFVDADMVPEPGCITELNQLAASTDNTVWNLTGWRTPDHLWPDRGENDPIPLDIVNFYLSDDPERWHRLYSEARPWYGNKVYGPVLVPRVSWEAVNGYHEGYAGWGGEDDDFLIRLQRAGCRLMPSERPGFIQCPHVSTRLIDPPGTKDRNISLLNERLF